MLLFRHKKRVKGRHTDSLKDKNEDTFANYEEIDELQQFPPHIDTSKNLAYYDVNKLPVGN